MATRIANTPIAVDCWQPSLYQNARLFFLTHMHGDHTIGLSSRWSQIIHCSPITKRLLMHKFQIAENLIKAIEPNETIVVHLDDAFSELVTITAIDANHIPGSLMFLFQGYFGAILHTGDFRFCKEMFSHGAALWQQAVDVVYMDNTYLHTPQFIPTRGEATNMCIQKIKEKRGHRIFIALQNYGKEQLLVALAQEFNTPIVTQPHRMQKFQLMNLPDVFTTIRSRGFIETIDLKSVESSVLSSYIGNEPEFIIHPTALRTVNKPNMCTVPYSDHSSYGDLYEFVRLLRPKCIKLIVPGRSQTNTLPAEFVKCLNPEPRPYYEIPRSVQAFMQSGRTVKTAVHRLPRTLAAAAALRKPLAPAKSRAKKGVQFHVYTEIKENVRTCTSGENLSKSIEHNMNSDQNQKSRTPTFALSGKFRDVITQSRPSVLGAMDQLSEHVAVADRKWAPQASTGEGPAPVPYSTSKDASDAPACGCSVPDQYPGHGEEQGAANGDESDLQVVSYEPRRRKMESAFVKAEQTLDTSVSQGGTCGETAGNYGGRSTVIEGISAQPQNAELERLRSGSPESTASSCSEFSCAFTQLFRQNQEGSIPGTDAARPLFVVNNNSEAGLIDTPSDTLLTTPIRQTVSETAFTESGIRDTGNSVLASRYGSKSNSAEPYRTTPGGQSASSGDSKIVGTSSPENGKASSVAQRCTKEECTKDACGAKSSRVPKKDDEHGVGGVKDGAGAFIVNSTAARGVCYKSNAGRTAGNDVSVASPGQSANSAPSSRSSVFSRCTLVHSKTEKPLRVPIIKHKRMIDEKEANKQGSQKCSLSEHSQRKCPSSGNIYTHDQDKRSRKHATRKLSSSRKKRPRTVYKSSVKISEEAAANIRRQTATIFKILNSQRTPASNEGETAAENEAKVSQTVMSQSTSKTPKSGPTQHSFERVEGTGCSFASRVLTRSGEKSREQSEKATKRKILNSSKIFETVGKMLNAETNQFHMNIKNVLSFDKKTVTRSVECRDAENRTENFPEGEKKNSRAERLCSSQRSFGTRDEGEGLQRRISDAQAIRNFVLNDTVECSQTSANSERRSRRATSVAEQNVSGLTKETSRATGGSCFTADVQNTQESSSIVRKPRELGEETGPGMAVRRRVGVRSHLPHHGTAEWAETDAPRQDNVAALSECNSKWPTTSRTDSTLQTSSLTKLDKEQRHCSLSELHAKTRNRPLPFPKAEIVRLPQKILLPHSRRASTHISTKMKASLESGNEHHISGSDSHHANASSTVSKLHNLQIDSPDLNPRRIAQARGIARGSAADVPSAPTKIEEDDVHSQSSASSDVRGETAAEAVTNTRVSPAKQTTQAGVDSPPDRQTTLPAIRPQFSDMRGEKKSESDRISENDRDLHSVICNQTRMHSVSVCLVPEADDRLPWREIADNAVTELRNCEENERKGGQALAEWQHMNSVPGQDRVAEKNKKWLPVETTQVSSVDSKLASQNPHEKQWWNPQENRDNHYIQSDRSVDTGTMIEKMTIYGRLTSVSKPQDRNDAELEGRMVDNLDLTEVVCTLNPEDEDIHSLRLFVLGENWQVDIPEQVERGDKASLEQRNVSARRCSDEVKVRSKGHDWAVVSGVTRHPTALGWRVTKAQQMQTKLDDCLRKVVMESQVFSDTQRQDEDKSLGPGEQLKLQSEDIPRSKETSQAEDSSHEEGSDSAPEADQLSDCARVTDNVEKSEAQEVALNQRHSETVVGKTSVSLSNVENSSVVLRSMESCDVVFGSEIENNQFSVIESMAATTGGSLNRKAVERARPPPECLEGAGNHGTSGEAVSPGIINAYTVSKSVDRVFTESSTLSQRASLCIAVTELPHPEALPEIFREKTSTSADKEEEEGIRALSKERQSASVRFSESSTAEDLDYTGILSKLTESVGRSDEAGDHITETRALHPSRPFTHDPGADLTVERGFRSELNINDGLVPNPSTSTEDCSAEVSLQWNIAQAAEGASITEEARAGDATCEPEPAGSGIVSAVLKSLDRVDQSGEIKQVEHGDALNLSLRKDIEQVSVTQDAENIMKEHDIEKKTVVSRDDCLPEAKKSDNPIGLTAHGSTGRCRVILRNGGNLSSKQIVEGEDLEWRAGYDEWMGEQGSGVGCKRKRDPSIAAPSRDCDGDLVVQPELKRRKIKLPAASKSQRKKLPSRVVCRASSSGGDINSESYSRIATNRNIVLSHKDIDGSKKKQVSKKIYDLDSKTENASKLIDKRTPESHAVYSVSGSGESSSLSDQDIFADHTRRDCRTSTPIARQLFSGSDNASLKLLESSVESLDPVIIERERTPGSSALDDSRNKSRGQRSHSDASTPSPIKVKRPNKVRSDFVPKYCHSDTEGVSERNLQSAPFDRQRLAGEPVNTDVDANGVFNCASAILSAPSIPGTPATLHTQRIHSPAKSRCVCFGENPTGILKHGGEVVGNIRRNISPDSFYVRDSVHGTQSTRALKNMQTGSAESGNLLSEALSGGDMSDLILPDASTRRSPPTGSGHRGYPTPPVHCCENSQGRNGDNVEKHGSQTSSPGRQDPRRNSLEWLIAREIVTRSKIVYKQKPSPSRRRAMLSCCPKAICVVKKKSSNHHHIKPFYCVVKNKSGISE